MLKIEKLEQESARTHSAARHAEALFLGLNREPQNYEFNGEIVDMGPEGRCLCGHPIRNGFVLDHKRKIGCLCHPGKVTDQKIVGSSCVHYFAGINEELYKALLDGVAEWNKRIAEAKKQIRQAKAQKEVDALAARFEALYDYGMSWYKADRARGKRSPRHIWEAFGSNSSWMRVPSGPPEYTRPADYKRWYGQQIKRLEALLPNFKYQEAA